MCNTPSAALVPADTADAVIHNLSLIQGEVAQTAAGITGDQLAALVAELAGPIRCS